MYDNGKRIMHQYNVGTKYNVVNFYEKQFPKILSEDGYMTKHKPGHI